MFKLKNLIPYLMLMPALALMFFLMIFPIFWNVDLAIHDVEISTLNEIWDFTGFKNFIQIFKNDKFLESLKVSLFFVAGCVTLQFIIGFAIARILVEKVIGTKIFRILFIFPWLLSATIVGYSWRWLYNDFSGLINLTLMGFNIEPVPWISNPNVALISLIIANVWYGTPFSILFQESALLTIDHQLYEAARIDGASPFKCLTRITLPLLKPFIAINLILITMWTINIFDLQLIMTNGGPLNSTTTASLYMYKQAFEQGKMSLGATVGIILLAINLCISFVYLKLLRSERA